MKVYVPATEVQLATRLYMQNQLVEKDVQYEIVDVYLDPWAYTGHLEECWHRGETFVNLEHDIVPWPGAITAITECTEPWCFYGYVPEIDCVKNGCAPLGLAKITSELIKLYPDVWKVMREYYTPLDYEYVWQQNDIWLFDYIVNQKKGAPPHQHFPSVFNANPNS